MPESVDDSSTSQRLSIYDLARLSKVSTGTVSRVLNNSERVRDETRERVLRVARRHGMRPRATARRHQVALLTSPPTDGVMGGYVSCLTQHLAYALASRGLGLLMIPEDRAADLESHLVDGVIAVAWRQEAIAVLESLTRTPVVFINRLDLTDRFSAVGTDHAEAGRRAAEHFLQRGHRRLALLNDKPTGWAAQSRIAGYSAAMQKAGIEPDDNRFAAYQRSPELETTVRGLLEAGTDAIWAPAEDMQAMRLLHVLQEQLGCRVPEDVSVIGGENPGISEHTCPALTTIEQPLRQMADRALELLLHMAKHEPTGPSRVILPIHLNQRASVAERTP